MKINEIAIAEKYWRLISSAGNLYTFKQPLEVFSPESLKILLDL